MAGVWVRGIAGEPTGMVGREEVMTGGVMDSGGLLKVGGGGGKEC